MLNAGATRWFLMVLAAVSFVVVFGGTAIAVTGDDTPVLKAGLHPKEGDEDAEARLLQLDAFSTSGRLAGDNPLDVGQAATLRTGAAKAARKLAKHAPGDGPHTFDNPWTALGPNPIVTAARSDSAFYALSGRIGALAIRPSNGEFILGGAQGGIWTSTDSGGTWVPRTDDQDTLTIGALAVAPSNDSVVYAGTGEGALSGDSMFGDGILKSTDGGTTWTHVSGDYFVGVSVSRLVVDPANPNHLYAAILRGRGGARRVSPPTHSRFGIWESTDGGVTWTLLQGGSGGERRHRPRDRSPELEHPLRVVLGRRDVQEHRRRPHLGADHERPARRRRLRRRGDAILDRDLAPVGGVPAVLYSGFDWNDAERRTTSRRSSSRRTPARAGLRPAPGRTTRTTSRTTAARSASTTT